MSLKENKTLLYTSMVEAFVSKYPKEIWASSAKDDKLDYEWIAEINEHWKQFDPPTNSLYSLLIAIYSLMMSFGCTGNILVVYLIVRSRSLRNPVNYLVLNLAISDLLILGTNLPALIYNSVQQGPATGRLGCQLYGFIGALCGTTSIMTLAAISLDRYYVIVFPLLPFKNKSNRRVSVLITGIWNYGIVFSVLPLLGVNAYVPEGILTGCSFDYLATDINSRIYIFVFFLAAWLVPVSIITFSYIMIYQTVARAKYLNFLQETPKTSSASEMPRCFRFGRYMDRRKIELKIAKTAFIAVTLWIVTWTPYAILALIGIFVGPNKYLTPMASLAPSLICKLGSCLNPIVYALQHPKFRRELRLTMLRVRLLFCCNSQAVQVQSVIALELTSFSRGSVGYRRNFHVVKNSSISNPFDQMQRRNDSTTFTASLTATTGLYV